MQTFAETHPDLIAALTPDQLVHPSAIGRPWTFVEGAPAPNWQNERRPGRDFALDACIDLDKLCANPIVPCQSEGVVYTAITASRDGIMMLGIGADWWAEGYCNGELVLDTTVTGNGQSLIMAENHRVLMPVKQGENLLAIRIRRGSATWNFACLAWISFAPPAEPALTHGPWLSNADTDTLTVNFTCSTPLGCGVEYRPAGTADWTLVWHQRQGQILRRTFHAIHLCHLTPAQAYEYRIVCIHPDTYVKTPLGDTHSFCLPAPNVTTFSVFFTADLQFSLDTQHRLFGNMLKASHAETCDLFVLDGDVNSAFLPDDVIRGPFEQLQSCGTDHKPLVIIRGNHELRGAAGDQFLDYFASQDGTSYSVFRHGDTAFMVIDSWEDKPANTPGHAYCKWNLDDVFIQAETEWLAQAVKDPKWTQATRRVVLCHGAAYSHYDSCLTIPFVLQKMTDPYFAGKNPLSRLNLWLTGHIHQYLRSIPGTAEIAAPEPPPKPFKDGTDYVYPVLTVAGPTSRSKLQASCFRLDFDDTGISIRSWDHEGKPVEDIRLDNNGSLTENLSLPHYIPE